MEALFRLSIVTAEESVLDAQVSYVNLPTPFGSLGILARHAPMLCAVEKGIVRCKLEGGQSARILVGDGVASVADNELTLLVADGKILEE